MTNNNQNGEREMANPQLTNEIEKLTAECFADLLISKGANASNVTLESCEKMVNDNWDFIVKGMNMAFSTAIARA
jgi:hypothetical protein